MLLCGEEFSQFIKESKKLLDSLLFKFTTASWERQFNLLLSCASMRLWLSTQQAREMACAGSSPSPSPIYDQCESTLLLVSLFPHFLCENFLLVSPPLLRYLLGEGVGVCSSTPFATTVSCVLLYLRFGWEPVPRSARKMQKIKFGFRASLQYPVHAFVEGHLWDLGMGIWPKKSIPPSDSSSSSARW